MSAAFKLLFLAGDGIGPEVLAASEKVLVAIGDKYDFAFDIQRADIGGAAIDAEGVPLSDATLAQAKGVDATLMGAVGGPKWDNVAREIRPEAGLLKIRKGLDLFANLRPAWCFDALADASSLKRELVEGLDILIVRELTAGVYFGQPRGMVDGGARCVDTQSYTEAEVKRVARVGFEVARSRSGKLCSADKANVMETGHFWRGIVSEIGAKEYPDVELSHMYADNCAMQLVRYPKQFDVIVTDNLFGDILSDQAAMLTGSLGMLPSASLGVPTGSGADVTYKAALYEPVHGSAPDIAGQGLANPLGAIMSLAMLLKYSCKRADLAKKIEDAIGRALKSGVRTADIASAQHKSTASTADITQAVISEL